MQKRVRVIKTSQGSENNEVYGIAIPKSIAMFCKETYFTINRSGGDILLISGTKKEFNEKEINEYKFEDCRI